MAREYAYVGHFQEESVFSEKAIAENTQEEVIQKIEEEQWSGFLLGLLFWECCYCRKGFAAYHEELGSVQICVSVDLTGRPSLTRACFNCYHFRSDLGKAIGSTDKWVIC